MILKRTHFLAIVLTFITIIHLHAQTNLISNGTFTTTKTPWRTSTWNGGSSSLSGGGLLYTLTKAGSYPWDNKVYQEDIILEQGQRYVLSFDARSIEGNRNIRYGFYDTQKNSVGYAGDTTCLVTTTTSNYSLAFTMMSNTDYDVTFAFDCGLSSIDLWVDNVTLVKVTDNRIPEVIPVASPTIERRPLLAWHPALEAVTDYTIQISKSPIFDTLIVNQKVTDTSYTLLADLPISPIYWRVQGEDSYWSTNSFIVKDARIPTPEQYENPTYERQPTLKWSKPPVAVSSYTIEVATSPLFGSGNVLLINSVTDTFYTISASLPLGEIYWRVKAEDSDYSELSTFVVIDNRIPELIPYENPTYTRRPKLTWHSALGTVSAYQIQVATDPSFTSIEVLLAVSDTSYTCATDLPIGNIYWRVRGDDSEFSSTGTFEIKDIRIPKIIPVEPKLTENQRQPVSWNSVSGATTYTIQLSSSSLFSSFLASLSLSDTVFTPTANLTPGTIYCRVKSDLVDQWSDIEYFTVLSDTLPLLYRYNGQSVATRRPEFKWKSVSGATSYKIMYADNAGFVNASVIPTSDTSYVPTIDLADGSWYWKVSSSRDLNTFSPSDEVVIDLTQQDIPVIITEPLSQNVTGGESVSFTVEATGSAPFTYKWLKDGAEIANATEVFLTIENVTDADDGEYKCIVTNAFGSDTSSVAVLKVDMTNLVKLGFSSGDFSISLLGQGILYSGKLKDLLSVDIVDMRGRTIKRIQEVNENIRLAKKLNDSGMNTGSYILRVNLKNHKVSIKKFLYTK